MTSGVVVETFTHTWRQLQVTSRFPSIFRAEVKNLALVKDSQRVKLHLPCITAWYGGGGVTGNLTIDQFLFNKRFKTLPNPTN